MLVVLKIPISSAKTIFNRYPSDNQIRFEQVSQRYGSVRRGPILCLRYKIELVSSELGVYLGQ